MSEVYATAIVKKLDNGYRGLFLNHSERGLWEEGKEIFNRHLHDFPKGSILRVVMTISPKGRKMVKEVHLKDAAPTAAEELAEKLPPAPVPAKRFSGYYVGHEERLVFNTVLGMSLENPVRPVKVMMVGPSGYGKTTLPKYFAQLAGKKYLRMNCATVRDPEEWFGYREARGGSTVFVRSQFAKALEEGNLVVVLDEFNRLEPWLHNTLFPLLDDDGFTVVHDEEFRIGPGVIVVGTINSGYKYTGTFELDEALLNRFEFVLEVGPMPFEEEVKVLRQRTGIGEEQASNLVKTAKILRSNEVACSTRTSLLVANMVVAGMTLREAFESAVVKRIPQGESSFRKHVVDLVNVQLGTLTGRHLDVDVFALGDAPKEEGAEQESFRHMLVLFVTEREKVQHLPLLQAIRNLSVVGAKLSAARAGKLGNLLWDGETVSIELKDKPANLEEFANLGVLAIYNRLEA